MLYRLTKPQFTALITFAGAFLFYFLWLNHPNQLFWDEGIHVNAARTILYGKWPYSGQQQPPLGKEILLTSIYLFGDTPLGARVLSVFAGAGSVALVYLISFLFTRNQFASLLAPLLLLSDTLFYVHSRIGMLDIFLSFFMVLSFYLFLDTYDLPVSKLSPWRYYLISLTASLAFTVKAVGIVLLPIYFLAFLITILKTDEAIHKKRNLFHLCLSFFLLPPLIFLLPYFLLGYSPAQIKDHLIWYWNFQHSFKAYPTIVSYWYDWILVKRPVWYFRKGLDANLVSAVVCTGNYLLWFVAEIIFFVLIFFWKRLPRKIFFIHLIIVSQFVFWSIKKAPTIYYMMSIIPFYVLLIPLLFKFLLDSYPKRAKYLRFDTIALVISCFIVFGYYFPLLTGRPIDKSKMNRYLFPGVEAPLSIDNNSLNSPPP